MRAKKIKPLLSASILLVIAIAVIMYGTDRLKWSQRAYVSQEGSNALQARSVKETNAIDKEIYNMMKKSAEDFERQHGFLPDQMKNDLKSVKESMNHDKHRQWKGKIIFLLSLSISVLLLLTAAIIVRKALK